MNYWHTHDDGFRGTHTHEVGGSNVEHAHSGDALEVVSMLGHRYKQPEPMPAPTGESDGTLDVQDVTQAHAADSAG